jgi:hypothetical protein
MGSRWSLHAYEMYAVEERAFIYTTFVNCGPARNVTESFVDSILHQQYSTLYLLEFKMIPQAKHICKRRMYLSEYKTTPIIDTCR